MQCHTACDAGQPQRVLRASLYKPGPHPTPDRSPSPHFATLASAVRQTKASMRSAWVQSYACGCRRCGVIGLLQACTAGTGQPHSVLHLNKNPRGHACGSCQQDSEPG
jgi:hypothetical protein